jgi:4-amino-4-deoxy-L-arabinose transferase-like glycosyltransferase
MSRRVADTEGVPRKIPRLIWVVPLLAYLIYFFDLSGTGLLGPDEPRYAAIAREMARSGDWITPRLWSGPWFEKPVLIYWMGGAAFRLGLGTELAPRLPVAILAVAFLVFYWWMLRREFGERAAWLATLILGTSGMYVAYSQNGVTDLPLTAAYSAAMLLAMPWVARRDGRLLPAAAALFGVAALAKGLVPIFLAAPLAMGLRTPAHLRDWLRWRVWLPFCVVALPWYGLCYWRNGWVFIHDFFVVHTFSRVTSGALMHGQRWWFYLPMLAVGLLPWLPLVGLLMKRGDYLERRRGFLALWAVTVLVEFSIPPNKLPGYILPMMPAVAGLMGLALDELKRDARWLLATCAATLVVFPIAAQLLPAAVRNGLSRAPWPTLDAAGAAAGLAVLGLAALVWVLEARGRRVGAVLAVAAGTAVGVAYLKGVATPQLDAGVSARALGREIGGREVCLGDVKLGDVKRNWEYGLDYYLGRQLPLCTSAPKALRVLPGAGGAAYLVHDP